MPILEPFNRRFFYPTPGWLVIFSLAMTGILFLSERFQWFGFNSHKGWPVLDAVAGIGGVLIVLLLWYVVALVFRKRFQFSIRSLLVLTVAAALPLSWLAVEMKKAREQSDAVQIIEKCGGVVTNQWQLYGILPPLQPPEPAWLRNCLGDDFFVGIIGIQFRTGEITDAGLVHVTGLTQLRQLQLSRTQVTDAGLVHLAGLTELQWLDLSDTQVADGGLAHLIGLNQLQDLLLGRTQLTDAGLVHIARLTQLHWLDLRGTKVTAEGVAKLQKALPNCKITR